MTVTPPAASPERPPSTLLVEQWIAVIRALEDRYAAAERHTDAEVRAVAEQAAAVSAQPPALLSARQEVVTTTR